MQLRKKNYKEEKKKKKKGVVTGIGSHYLGG